MYKVVADNSDFVVIDKFPGVGFHGEAGAGGLTAALRADLGIASVYTVHRLDTMTSGLILFAKQRDIARELAAQFQRRDVEKWYVAISDRRPKKKQGLIIGDMERARRGMWKLAHTRTNPAVTRFYSRAYAENLRLFVVKPQTGKTHQIRVALKSIGAPVLGDPLYYRESAARDDVDRGYLHSYALAFHLKGDEFRFVNMPTAGAYFVDDAFRDAFEAYLRI